MASKKEPTYHCSKCKKNIDIEKSMIRESRKINDYKFFSVFVKCKECGHTEHSYYDNSRIKRMAKIMRKNLEKAKREFTKGTQKASADETRLGELRIDFWAKKNEIQDKYKKVFDAEQKHINKLLGAKISD